jgi:hypothetical protein
MPFNLEDSTVILRRTPHVVRALIAGLPEALVYSNYGEKTWSPHEVVGHLIHGEKTDWIPRARLIMESGDAVAFEPFDRNGHAALCREKKIGDLLDIFASLRAANLDTLRSLSLNPSDLARPGRHPALGPVTLSQLLAAWVAHDQNHIAQICKAIAFQYHDEVGPWTAYLSILAPPAPR